MGAGADGFVLGCVVGSVVAGSSGVAGTNPPPPVDPPGFSGPVEL